MVRTVSFTRLESLTHEIQAHYRALRAIRTRKALEQSALWAEIGAGLAMLPVSMTDVLSFTAFWLQSTDLRPSGEERV